MKMRRERDFVSFFDEATGRYFRTGVIKDGQDTGRDPFMASFPELLDVGIMGHCVHGQKGLCQKAGIECYQDGLHSRAENMRLEDFGDIAMQCRGQAYQFALGGCGDPDQHEQFGEILEICVQAGIVPNFTTSGFGMDQDTARLCSRYCGAVAVSWYRSEYTVRAVEQLVQAGVKVNIHYVLGRHTIEEAVWLLQSQGFPSGVNAIVFLLHKPVGLGSQQNVITLENHAFQEFLRLVNSGKMQYKIGFDSCTVPALVNAPGEICMESLDTCEGARWSAYISSDMQMMPCSFDNQDMRWAVDLRSHTIAEAWKSKEFEEFRSCLREACPGCGKRGLCMGGCPIRPEIVLCGQLAEQRWEDVAAG